MACRSPCVSVLEGEAEGDFRDAGAESPPEREAFDGPEPPFPEQSATATPTTATTATAMPIFRRSRLRLPPPFPRRMTSMMIGAVPGSGNGAKMCSSVAPDESSGHSGGDSGNGGVRTAFPQEGHSNSWLNIVASNERCCPQCGQEMVNSSSGMARTAEVYRVTEPWGRDRSGWDLCPRS